MTNSDMRRLIRRTGILDVTEPVDLLRIQKATREVVDPSGQLRNKAGDPYRSPQTITWFSGDPTRVERVAQAGTAVLFSAYADTAPTSGNCVVSLVVDGAVVSSLTILQYQSTGEMPMTLILPNGAWIGAAVTIVNGAANISTSLTVSLGSNP